MGIGSLPNKDLIFFGAILQKQMGSIEMWKICYLTYLRNVIALFPAVIIEYML